MTPTTIRDRAAQLAHLGLQYIGPGPCAASTWAYDERGRAIVIDKTGAEISPTTPGTRGRTVARSAELIEATRTAGHLISYAGGNRPAEVRTPLPEHLHACRARHDQLSDNLGDELHPAGECTTRVPFDPAAPTSVDHVKATPSGPSPSSVLPPRHRRRKPSQPGTPARAASAGPTTAPATASSWRTDPRSHPYTPPAPNTPTAPPTCPPTTSTPPPNNCRLRVPPSNQPTSKGTLSCPHREPLISTRCSTPMKPTAGSPMTDGR